MPTPPPRMWEWRGGIPPTLQVMTRRVTSTTKMSLTLHPSLRTRDKRRCRRDSSPEGGSRVLENGGQWSTTEERPRTRFRSEFATNSVWLAWVRAQGKPETFIDRGGLRDLPSAFCLPLPRTGLSHSLTETISLVHFRRTRAWLHLCCACHPPGHYLQGHVNSPKFQTFPYPKESGPSCQVCRAECLFGTLSITVKIVENDKFLNKCVLRTRVCILFNNFGGRDRP